MEETVTFLHGMWPSWECFHKNHPLYPALSNSNADFSVIIQVSQCDLCPHPVKSNQIISKHVKSNITDHNHPEPCGIQKSSRNHPDMPSSTTSMAFLNGPATLWAPVSEVQAAPWNWWHGRPWHGLPSGEAVGSVAAKIKTWGYFIYYDCK